MGDRLHNCTFLHFRASKLAMTLETFSAGNIFDSIERIANEDSFFGLEQNTDSF